jgi:hypothetical protein
MKTCNICGKEFLGEVYPVKSQKEAIQCMDCFARSLGISPQAMREAEEISFDDLQAGADMYDKLKAGTFYDGYPAPAFLENKQTFKFNQR